MKRAGNPGWVKWAIRLGALALVSVGIDLVITHLGVMTCITALFLFLVGVMAVFIDTEPEE